MKRKQSLEDRLQIAKEDDYERNKLIEEYRPFIASVVQKRVGRYVEYGIDDELSISLMAFNEAIDKFDRDQGNFLSFAKVVIQRRLIDYNRKNRKINVVYNSDDDTVVELYDQKGIERYNIENTNQLRKSEIQEYQEELLEWGLDFENLVNNSPKHKKRRELCKEIAQNLVNDEELMVYINKTKRLPIQKIEKKYKIHRKKLERSRIYILALIIIINGDYELLKDYI